MQNVLYRSHKVRPISKLADTLKTTVQTKTVDNLDSKTERKRFKNRNFD
jgi:hypothetical protein